MDTLIVATVVVGAGAATVGAYRLFARRQPKPEPPDKGSEKALESRTVISFKPDAASAEGG
ncbi:MAG: hypothetical protein EXR58_08355 [Chloroflexi bacterium]|nr:hypothetical protein [Chloroflexota bacterium]